MLDNAENPQDSARATVPPMQFLGVAPCADNLEIPELIKFGHGGYRPGAGRKPKVEPIQDNTFRWFCVRTFINQDLTADIQVRLAGYEVFAPTIWKPATLTTRDRNGIVRPGIPARIEPFFRSYFFARFCRADPQWTKILHLPGVRTVLSHIPGRPIAVPDHVIDALRAPLHPNGCDYSLQNPVRTKPLDKDARVRVMTGPMADAMEQDLIGICEMSDGKRVKVLLQIMGRAVSVTMAQSAVEVVK